MITSIVNGAAHVEVHEPHTADRLMATQCFSSSCQVAGLPGLKIHQTMSWTDAFLQAMGVLAAADPDPVPADIDALDVNRIDTLAVFPGDRHLCVFRPNPFRQDRPLRIDVHAASQDTVADIQFQLLQQWPDLVAGQDNWFLRQAHHTSTDSLEIADRCDPFMLVAQADTTFPFEVMVGLVERQTWYLGNSWYTASLEPLIIPRHITAGRIASFLGIGPVCQKTLCPVRLNRKTVWPAESFHEEHGSFLTIAWIPEDDAIHRIAGPLTRDVRLPPDAIMQADLTEVPAQFPYDVARQVTAQHRDTGPSVIPTAAGLQLSITDWYRWVYWQTGIHQLHTEIFWACERKDFFQSPIEFHAFSKDLAFDLPTFYQKLAEKMNTVRFHLALGWNLVQINHHVRERMSGPNRRVFALVELIARDPPFNLNFVLVEMMITDRLGMFSLPSTFHSLMIETQTSRQALLERMELQDECSGIECVMMLDGQFVPYDEQPVITFDGSFLQIWKGPHLDPMDVEGEAAIPLGTEDPLPASSCSEQQPRLPAVFGRGSTSSVGAPPPSRIVQQVLDWIITMLLFLFSPARPNFQHCKKPRWVGNRRRQKRRGQESSRRYLFKNCSSSHTLIYVLLMSQMIPQALGQNLVWNAPVERLGEASNPGPSIWLGTTNPGGIRQKEWLYTDSFHSAFGESPRPTLPNKDSGQFEGHSNNLPDRTTDI